MAIQDQNRSRKTYSFFRATPVLLPTTTTGADLLYYPNVAQLQAVDPNIFENGKIAFVSTLRDYFSFEKTINSGSTDSIQDIAAGGYSGGVWHRMNLGGGYWKNQLVWYIDSVYGHDENIGAIDSPLKTLDEFIRRLGSQKIRSNYTVTLLNPILSTENLFGLDIEFDGGSITIDSIYSTSSLGNITSLSSDINYSSAVVPKIGISGGGSYDNDLLCIDNDILCWALSGTTDEIHTTPFFTGAIGQNLLKATLPTINTPGIVARGFGDFIFKNIKLGLTSSNQIVISGDQISEITLINSSLQANAIIIANGTLKLNNSRISNGNETLLINNSQLYGTGSGFIPYGSGNILISCNSHVELGSSIFSKTMLSISDSIVSFGVNNTSGSALNNADIVLKSNSVVDVRNLISTNSLSSPVSIAGQNCTVFYDTVSLPKAEPLNINNGTVQNFLWSSLPWQDTLRQTYVVSGSINNSWSV